MNLKNNKSWIHLISIFIIGVLLRWWFISNNNIQFLYDQARDARVSREILENRDIKIFGPTASGSNDKLYHGVFYYYLIGPLYTLFLGNPSNLAIVLSFLLALSVLSSYHFAYQFSNDRKLSFIIASFSVISFSNILATSWLSNPMFLFITIPAYYAFVLAYLKHPSYKQLALVILMAGLSMQFSLFTAYLWIVILLIYLYTLINHSITFSIKSFLILGLVFLGVTGTMISAEVIQWRRGILFNSQPLSNTAFSFDIFNSFKIYWNIFSTHLGESIFPNFPILSIILGIMGIILCIKLADKNQRILIILTLVSPFLFFIIQPRNNYHTLLGNQPLLLTITLYGLSRIIPSKRSIVLIIALNCIVFSQLSQVVYFKNKNGHSPYFIQKGVMLHNQLELIDYTYSQAAGQPFSISTLTKPYLYNITWDYLYDWYGKKTYGYTPLFKGIDQSVQFGVKLKRTDTFSPLHFAIIEADVGLGESYILKFKPEQSLYSNATPSGILMFNQLKLIEFDNRREITQ